MTENPLKPEDADLFREAIGDVKRIVDDRANSGKPAPRPVPKQLEKDERQVLDDLLSGDYENLSLADGISFLRPGMQHNVMRKLRRGQYVINAELDLHGMTSAEARRALTIFLTEARQTGQQCLRIIHGKGLRSANSGPVLKPMVAKWLSQRDEVLAYCTARVTDGGSGAVYVLLKK